MGRWLSEMAATDRDALQGILGVWTDRAVVDLLVDAGYQEASINRVSYHRKGDCACD